MQADRNWSCIQKSTSIFAYGSLRGSHTKLYIFSQLHKKISLFSYCENIFSSPQFFLLSSLFVFSQLQFFFHLLSSLSVSPSPDIFLSSPLSLPLLSEQELVGSGQWRQQGGSREQAAVGGGKLSDLGPRCHYKRRNPSHFITHTQEAISLFYIYILSSLVEFRVRIVVRFPSFLIDSSMHAFSTLLLL